MSVLILVKIEEGERTDGAIHVTVSRETYVNQATDVENAVAETVDAVVQKIINLNKQERGAE